jgi:superfamily I DNA/RNA helicase
MKALVFTEGAINALASQEIEDDWFLTPDKPPAPGVNVREGRAAVLICTSQCGCESKLLIVRRSRTGLFGSVAEGERRQVFDRCARMALRAFGYPVNLNPRWSPFHDHNRVSVFAYNVDRGNERLTADVRGSDRQHLYVFDLSPANKAYHMTKLDDHNSEYEAAVEEFQQTCSALTQAESHQGVGQIELDSAGFADIGGAFSYSEWYPNRLSDRQRQFVRHDLSGPIRLRGAAGTGKTLAMAIKALKTAYDFEDAKKATRILFVTHSWAAAEHVDRLLLNLDDRGLLSRRDALVTVDVFPLLTLAERRDYAKVGRKPLGIDSSEGKLLALQEISDVVQSFVASDWIAYRSGVSKNLVDRLEALPNTREHRNLCWDLLVEFGCVLAAQGILSYSADRERYLRIKRLRWMMPLPEEADRQVVFALWTRFLRALAEKALISSDQIMTDYLSDLATFYWEAARTTEGYDVIFVDEMHLFNSQERLTFHNLLRQGDEPPVVIMALDPKQSPRETFANVSADDEPSTSSIYANARLPNAQVIDLVEVYRYTPEIAAVIRAVLEVAPALDLPDEWEVPEAFSKLASDETPTVAVVENALTTFRVAVERAKKVQSSTAERKGRVAILCLDEDRFSQYARAAAAQYKNEVFVIKSRDDTEKLRYSGKKFILSTPEYVAGLQFDTVILVDVNKDQVPDGKDFNYQLRRFLSELYLGMSRAERRLALLASKDQGGLTDVLKKAVQRDLLRQVSPDKLL